MEDLATDRIYRLMIAQRIKHREAVKITDENGEEIKHTPEFVSKIFDEELEKLLETATNEERETLKEARQLSEEMITRRTIRSDLNLINHRTEARKNHERVEF